MGKVRPGSPYEKGRTHTPQEVVELQYSEGSIGRVFALRIDDGEDLLESITNFVVDKKISSSIALFLGALRDSKAVMGPEETTIPPVPHWEEYQSAWETFGIATIYPSSSGPKLHIHSSLGRGRDSMTGCLREKARVYLVVEAVLLELIGLKATRDYDPSFGFNLLSMDKTLR